jgi:hypothetical protein
VETGFSQKSMLAIIEIDHVICVQVIPPERSVINQGIECPPPDIHLPYPS